MRCTQTIPHESPPTQRRHESPPVAAVTAASHPARPQRLVGLAAIVLITALAYLPIFRGGFIWDDETLITENRLLRTLGGLRAIWLEPARSPQYDPLGRLGGGAEERPGGPLLSPGPPPLSPLRPRAALGGALRPGLRRLRARGPQQDCCVYEHYEKALALEPALKQARENLNAVRAQQHGAPTR